jgi:hypothetical protein
MPDQHRSPARADSRARIPTTATDAGLGSLGPSVREWAATVHLLTAPAIAERTTPFLDHDRQAIGWPGLLEASRPWSAAERLLVHAALDLWNGAEPTSLYDAVTRLDDVNFTRLVEALRLRRGLSTKAAP